MTYRQLCTRLNRITTTDKLLNFSRVALSYGYTDLAEKALRRFEKKTGTVVTAKWAEPIKKDRGRVYSRSDGVTEEYPLM